MNKYVTILCYKDKYNNPAFVKTDVFAAKNYDSACSEGSRLLERMYPDEIEQGFNDWTISLDDLIEESKELEARF